MIRTSILPGVITDLLLTGALALLAKGWNEITLLDKRSRIKFLEEIERPEYYQKRQRDLYRYLGLALYAAGSYMAFTAMFPNIAIVFWKIATGMTILSCGAMVMSNGAVVNEYGVDVRKRQIEKQRNKALERKRLQEHP